jgi:hypothetical protein
MIQLSGQPPREEEPDDDPLDEALEESFPASDPPARSDPDTGIGRPSERKPDGRSRKD